ncbi:hypothetical protein AY488_02930 [Corynebacterium belfantii]|uniref:D-isomer specific 2-hydroxyacid dehydrogenase family protein n=1 Tax=Corynebacterium diphtheriae TaxID=1717 RepID=UPI000B4B15F2|nr:D-isomer specific 2-hydroxyacid dehydrogenase family protein [Corynebacterium diphtheriae]OWN23576.1 hypothetical protein AY486_10270 [Corynebacterium diphtheriae bv. mitis]OWN35683.1 hypothetical protein AY488_02930 [Corynebacterium belfantii]
MKYFMGPHVWQRTIADLEALEHQRVDTLEQAEAYINTESRPLRIPTIPDSVSFVQHCFTGVNQLIDAHVITDTGVRWANMAGGFAQPVAESALGLMLSQAHHHKAFALAGTWRVARDLDRSQQWLHSVGEPRCVVIFGAGGIAKELIRVLEPFGMHVIAVNRSGRSVAGADETFAMKDAHALWSRGDFIVNILPLTQETKGLVDRDVFAQMKPSAIFINVGRGATVVTDDLVDALQRGVIAGAGLEVVDPEPLPDSHALHSMPNCTITPHMAASDHVAELHVARIFDANAQAFTRGETMPTEVNPHLGY